MRIAVDLYMKDLKTQEIQIPVKYRSMLAAYIKDALHIIDEELYNKLYNNGRVAKKLSFVLRMFPAKMNKELDVFKFNHATLIISSSDVVLMSKLIAGIMQRKRFLYQERYQFKVKSVTVLDFPTFDKNQVTFKTLSPFLFEDENSKPVLIDDERFEKIMNIYTNSRFQGLYGRPLHTPLVIQSHKLTLCIVKETNRHAGGRELYYTTQRGEITLEGHPEDLELLYFDGFGKRASQGFGCLSL